MKIQRSINIAARAEKIWPFLVEPEKTIKWAVTLKKINYTSEQHSGINTSFYFEEKAVGILMKLHLITTEWVLGKSVAFQMTSGNFIRGYQQRYTIEPAPGGSLFTCFEDVKLPYGIFGKFAGLFRRSRSQSHLKHMLAALKCLAEA
jgi:hypothetical protein